jgi:thiol-disulfide isomerase/thioredoxin
MSKLLLLMVAFSLNAQDAPKTPELQKAVEAPKPHLIPATKSGELACDSKDGQGVIQGATDMKQILEHRAIFRDNMSKAEIPEALKTRWKAVRKPLTLVVAFGSWCGDSQRELPDFLALAKESNPFIEIHYVGVYRDKVAKASDWPKGVPQQEIKKVPTFWLFSLESGGVQKLLGSVVENPPKKGQKMSEAIVELIEAAS